MYRNIMVPLDGSPLGEQAIPAAVSLARKTSARLHLVHVRTMEWMIRPPLREPDEQAYLDDVCERVSDDMCESVSFALLPQAEPRLLGPNPSPAEVAKRLADYAEHNAIDLIVMATHGRGGVSRLYFGSVVEALVRLTRTPLFLIHPSTESATKRRVRAARFRRILVPLETGEMAGTVLAAARELGSCDDAELVLLRVLLPQAIATLPLDPLLPASSVLTAGDLPGAREAAETELERAAAELCEAGCTVRIDIVIERLPAVAILDYARDGHFNVIVVGTHARRGLERMLLGSVANKVIRGADRPVLLVPPGAATSETATAFEHASYAGKATGGVR